MKPSFWQRLDVAARHLAPLLLALLLIPISVVPTHIPGLSQVVPLLPMMAVYHWSLYRSDLMPATAVFMVGILQDLLMGTPVGLYALVYLAVHGAALTQRRFLIGKPFAIVWLGFALIAALAAVLSWLLATLFFVALLDPTTVFYQYLLTLGGYPALAWLFGQCQQLFLRYD